MKKTFLMLTLVISQFSFAGDLLCEKDASLKKLDDAVGAVEQIGRVISAGCNIKHGVGEIEFASYQKDTKKWIISHLNVVNEDLCKKDERRPSKIVQIAQDSIFGGENKLHKMTVNSLGIVINVEAVDASKGELKKIYSKFNLLGINSYERLDLRVVEQDNIDWDKATQERIPGLLDMGKIKD